MMSRYALLGQKCRDPARRQGLDVRAGFEPATSPLARGCSIQLSYSDFIIVASNPTKVKGYSPPVAISRLPRQLFALLDIA